MVERSATLDAVPDLYPVLESRRLRTTLDLLRFDPRQSTLPEKWSGPLSGCTQLLRLLCLRLNTTPHEPPGSDGNSVCKACRALPSRPLSPTDSADVSSVKAIHTSLIYPLGTCAKSDSLYHIRTSAHELDVPAFAQSIGRMSRMRLNEQSIWIASARLLFHKGRPL